MTDSDLPERVEPDARGGDPDSSPALDAADAGGNLVDASLGDGSLGDGSADALDGATKRTCLTEGWTVETAAAGTDVVELAADRSGRVHLALNSGTSTKIGTRGPTGWTFEDTGVVATNATFDPISGDAVLCRSNIIYRKRSGQAPSSETLPPLVPDAPIVSPGEWTYSGTCGIALDETGRAHAAFIVIDTITDPADEHDSIVYANDITGAWTWRPTRVGYIPNGFRHQWRLDVAAARSVTHIAWSWGRTTYCRLDNASGDCHRFGSWWAGAIPLAVPATAAYGGTSLQLDPAGAVWFAMAGNPNIDINSEDPERWFDQVTAFSPHATGWTAETVSKTGWWTHVEALSGCNPELELTSTGDPFVCWIHSERTDAQPTAASLRCALKTAGKYSGFAIDPNVVPAVPEPMRQVASAIGPDGCCHVAYRGLGGTIKYASDCR